MFKPFSLILLLLLGGCASHPASIEKNRLIDTRVDLAVAYLNIGNTERASFHLHRASLISKSNLRYQLAMGYYYEFTKQKSKANHVYQRLLNKFRHNPTVLNNVAQYECRNGHYLVADQLFTEAVTNANGSLNGEIYKNAALCSLKKKDTKTARQRLKQALDYQPHNNEILTLLSQVDNGMFSASRSTSGPHSSF